MKTLPKAMIELDMLGTPIDDTGRKAVEGLLATLSGMADMDSINAREWVLDIFGRLARNEVLSPLTGESWEWTEVPESQRFQIMNDHGPQWTIFNYQNNRESSVICAGDFRPKEDGEGGHEFQITMAIDLLALKVWREGQDFEATTTWMPITFPYMPQRYHMEIPKDRSKEDMQTLIREAREHFLNQQIQIVTAGKVQG